MERAIAISILAGVIITSVLIIEKKDESFSSLYIYPESYTNFPANDTVSFMYGVRSHERERTGYGLEIYVDNRLVDKKNFEIEPGEKHEENETLQTRGIKLPVEVVLVLVSPSQRYSARYWLKNPHEIPPAPVKTPASEITPEAGISMTPEGATSVIPESTVSATPEAIVSITPESTSSPAPAATRGSAPTAVPVLIDTRRGFNPKEISINAGDSVRWVNHDALSREFTLVSSEGLFSRFITEDKRFEYMFNATGTYSFYLKEYPDVKGVVNVK
ncbi:MAG: hypothetical protein OIN66_08230 [Candidatus Methanoperedens sp.]|nr:hypothetical protein [Candidatus Methanoperedens sp.]